MRRSFVIAGMVALTASAAPASADVIIGMVGPITGQYAIFGEQMRRGAAYMAE